MAATQYVPMISDKGSGFGLAKRSFGVNNLGVFYAVRYFGLRFTPIAFNETCPTMGTLLDTAT